MILDYLEENIGRTITLNEFEHKFSISRRNIGILMHRIRKEFLPDDYVIVSNFGVGYTLQAIKGNSE